MLVSADKDIFALEVDALVNPVNTVGIMGAGLAAQFKKRYPGNYDAYRRACKRGDLRVGSMFVFDLGMLSQPRYIVNFPTKAHWRDASQMAYIKNGLADLRRTVESYRIQSLALPMIGCGLGGLDWNDVRPMIVSIFKELSEVEVFLLEPDRPSDF